MNVNDLGSGLPEPFPSGTSKVNPKTIRHDAPQAAKPHGVFGSSHTRDPEVIRLVQSMNESAEIRPDRLSDVRKRVLAGEYLSRQAAERTANVIVDGRIFS